MKTDPWIWSTVLECGHAYTIKQRDGRLWIEVANAPAGMCPSAEPAHRCCSINPDQAMRMAKALREMAYALVEKNDANVRKHALEAREPSKGGLLAFQMLPDEMPSPMAPLDLPSDQQKKTRRPRRSTG